MKKVVNILMAVLVILYQFMPVTVLLKVNAAGETETTNFKKNAESYWSTKNAPIFYGATKITLEIGSIDSFNVKDTRFRIFAKDFEDGDLTDKITHTGTVDVHKAGTYYITYRVTDSHGNEATIKVPVIVKEPEKVVSDEEVSIPEEKIPDKKEENLGENEEIKDTEETKEIEEKVEETEPSTDTPAMEEKITEDEVIEDITEDEKQEDTDIENGYELSTTNEDKNIKTMSNETEDTTEENHYKINVERTLYTIPSVWNLSMAGTNRGNGHDRQILGVYLPAGTKVRARILSASNNIRVNFHANDSAVEGGAITLNTNGEWVDLQNVKNGESYDSVPLFSSSIMGKGEALDKVFKVELEYDSSTKELNYYHQNDNEAEFRQKWVNDNNTYSVIENEVMTVVVPLADINKLTNYHSRGFSSLDQFLEYWQKVVDRMDELIGLDLNPQDITDQNVRTKYLVKANIHGGGAAYYAGDHVGIHNSSISAFFEMNWGGLHEFAHGYQGSLGKGEMSLGEVANNIIGHYIQIDKSIYFHPGDWLGNLSVIEERKNNERFDKKVFQQTEVSTRLYAIINMFDCLEGGETYAKMFKWYRKAINEGKQMKNQDAYVLALADIYGINTIPYMEAWGLVISEPVQNEVYSHDYPMWSILKDTVSDSNLNNILQGENIDRKYSLVTNETLEKYEIKGNLKIKVDIDDIAKIKGKVIKVNSGEKTVQSIKIEDSMIKENTIEIENLSVGTYYLQMPVIDGYSQEHIYVQIKDGNDNIYDYVYQKAEDFEFNNYIYFTIYGYNYDTVGFNLKFSNHYQTATLTPGQAGMGGTEYIKIYDTEGNMVFEDDVAKNPNGKYFHFNDGVQTIDLKPGYVIEINYPTKYANKVKVFNSLTNEAIQQYAATSAITRYVILENGIRKETMSAEESEEIAYQNVKPTIIKIIEDYKAKATEEELNNKIKNFKEKQKVLNVYNQLRSEDQVPYQEFIKRIKQGGRPRVYLNGQLEYEIGDKVDLYSLITVSDNEDGEIIVNPKSTMINTSLDNKKAGTYSVIYKVSDSDDNITTYTLDITIKGSKEEENPIKPDREPEKPKDEVAKPKEEVKKPTNDDNNKISKEERVSNISEKGSDAMSSENNSTKVSEIENQKEEDNVTKESNSKQKENKKAVSTMTKEERLENFKKYEKRENLLALIGMLVTSILIIFVYFRIGKRKY